MEKLKEISTLFNISIEELTNDEIDISKKNKGNRNNPINKKNNIDLENNKNKNCFELKSLLLKLLKIQSKLNIKK